MQCIPDGAVLLAAPARGDPYYRPFRAELLTLFAGLLDCKHPDDTILIAADAATRRELLGRGVCPEQLYAHPLPDIWCRDAGPVLTPHGGVRFRRQPSDDDSPQFVRSINRGWTSFLGRAGIVAKPSDLIMDGGNYCHNGVDCAVVTERILSDNGITKEDLVGRLAPLTGTRKIAVLPVEPGDKLGHTDGMVSWLAPKCLAVSMFEDATFRHRVKTELMSVFPDVRLVSLPYAPTDRLWKGYPDATGVYANILHTANTAYVPQYDDRQEANRAAVSLARRYCRRKVIPVAMGQVAQMGGSLRCLTWQNRTSRDRWPL